MELQKKNPFGELIKQKARLYVHGGIQQEGIYFHNKFAPIVNWSTFILFIMMYDMAGWESIKIDYLLTFSKVTIASDVYLHLTSGFNVDGEDENETNFINLKKNLYANRQAAENWFDMLKTGLEDEVFK